MTHDVFTDDDFAKSKEYPNLEPHYFSSRRICADVVRGFEAEHMKPLIDKAASEFADKLWTMVENSLWDDTESNLQGMMYRTVDDIVRGLLSGEKWIMNKYVLGPRYECEKVRATVAKHITDELAAARIADLEDEIKRLKADNEWLRR